MRYPKSSIIHPVMRYGLAILGALLLVGFLLTLIYMFLGGIGFIYAQIVHCFVYQNLGAKTPSLDREAHLRRRRWDRSRRRARLAGH